MTREDAYYQRIKLLCGDFESYDAWLNSYLQNEDPLSDVVLKLVDCHGNIKDIEHVLNLFCLEKSFDEESVYERLRLEIWQQYKEGILDKDNTMSRLFTLSGKIPFCHFQNCLAALSDYYCLAEEKILDMEKFDVALEKWLRNGDDFSMEDMFCEKKVKLSN